MKATEANLLGFLKKSPQFIIPIYQRTYSWTEPQCRQLWDDIMRMGNDDSISAHFIGSIVYNRKGTLPSFQPNAPVGNRRSTTLNDYLPHNRGSRTPPRRRRAHRRILCQEASQLLPDPIRKRRARNAINYF